MNKTYKSYICSNPAPQVFWFRGESYNNITPGETTGVLRLYTGPVYYRLNTVILHCCKLQ